MSVKRYFDLPVQERKLIWVRLEEHAILKTFTQERGITMAEAIHLLIGPALAAANGLDYMKVLQEGGFLQERTPGLLPANRKPPSEA